VRIKAFTLPAEFAYEPLITKTDPELLDFFDGFQYRHDIIERIDQEVYAGMMVLVNGQQISLGLRKLVCYAVWGNPVDAYKHFEYSYQNEYMPHRYLPEHVILGHIPKPINYSKPRPTIDTSYKRHYPVRARMSRANDQGVGKRPRAHVTTLHLRDLHVLTFHRRSRSSNCGIPVRHCSERLPEG
jgi:hypothetical protein